MRPVMLSEAKHLGLDRCFSSEILRFAQNDMTSGSVGKFGGRGMKSDYRAFGIWKT
jgi:hypothetical protein